MREAEVKNFGSGLGVREDIFKLLDSNKGKMFLHLMSKMYGEPFDKNEFDYRVSYLAGITPETLNEIERMEKDIYHSRGKLSHNDRNVMLEFLSKFKSYALQYMLYSERLMGDSTKKYKENYKYDINPYDNEIARKKKSAKPKPKRPVKKVIKKKIIRKKK